MKDENLQNNNRQTSRLTNSLQAECRPDMTELPRIFNFPNVVMLCRVDDTMHLRLVEYKNELGLIFESGT